MSRTADTASGKSLRRGGELPLERSPGVSQESQILDG
jgi:hypothetical protein